MKNLVVSVMLIGVLGYFGAKFYLHHNVTNDLDRALAMVQPFADIQYEGVSSTMTGELSVEGISARFGSFRDRLEIDRVSIMTPGFWYLLNLDELGSRMTGADAELPKSLGFAIDGLRADVSDDFMKAISQAAREAAPEVDENDKAATCVGRHGFSMGMLKRLGYDNLVMSVSTGYRHEDGRLLVDVLADIEELESVLSD